MEQLWRSDCSVSGRHLGPQTRTSTTWAANPHRSRRPNELYRYEANRNFGDWLNHPLDAITRRDIVARFGRVDGAEGEIVDLDYEDYH